MLSWSRRSGGRRGRLGVPWREEAGGSVATAQPRSFAELLRRYRLAAGLTQDELAELAHLSVRAIGELERGGRRTPRKDTVALLADALGLGAGDRVLLEATARGRLSAPSNDRGSSVPAAQSSVPSLPSALVGRTRELAVLARQLADPGTPLMLVAGEPGIGKSTLLAEAARCAREQGWTVLSGGCHRRSGQESYAPFVATLARYLLARSPAQLRLDLQGCTWLVRLLPELAEHATVPAPSWQLPPEQERRLMFTAVSRLLANIADPAGGTLVILDDLQWAPADALDLLAALLREPASPSLRILGAYRDTDVTPADPLPMLLADLSRGGIAGRLPLGPLTREAATQLLANLLAHEHDAPDGDSRRSQQVQDALLDRAGGVPFYLVSCSQALRTEGDTERRQSDVPWTVAESIRQRQVGLPAGARELLGVAAVAGRQVARTVLLRVAHGLGYREVQTLACLDAICQARLMVEEADGSYVFAHDLVRETLIADLGSARRSVLHRMIAQALEETPTLRRNAAELAWHFAEGDAPERALPYALEAGDAAEAVYAHAEADRHYRMALELARHVGDQECEAETLEKLADALYWLACYREAATLLDAAIVVYRAIRNWERLAWATAELTKICVEIGPAEMERGLSRVEELLILLASIADANPRCAAPPGAGVADVEIAPRADHWLATPGMLEDRAARAASLLTPRTAARVYSCLGLHMHVLGRYQEACAVSETAVTYARAAADRRIESLAHAVRSNSLRMLGRVDEAWTVAQAARRAALESGDLDVLSRALPNATVICELKGEYVRCRELLLEHLQAAQQLGARGQIAAVLCELACVTFLLGDWEEARRLYHQAEEAAQQGDMNALQAVAVRLAYLDLVQGAPDVPSRSFASILEDAADDGEHRAAPRLRAVAVLALAEPDLLLGNGARARSRLLGAIGSEAQNSPEGVDLVTLRAWVELEQGRHEDALRAIKEARAMANAKGNRAARVEIERIEGLIAVRDGRYDDAQRALEEALTLARAMPFPYAEAKALHGYGQLHQAQSESEQARERYEQALAICARLGERLYAERIEQALGEIASQRPMP